MNKWCVLFLLQACSLAQASQMAEVITRVHDVDATPLFNMLSVETNLDVLKVLLDDVGATSNEEALKSLLGLLVREQSASRLHKEALLEKINQLQQKVDQENAEFVQMRMRFCELKDEKKVLLKRREAIAECAENNNSKQAMELQATIDLLKRQLEDAQGEKRTHEENAEVSHQPCKTKLLVERERVRELEEELAVLRKENQYAKASVTRLKNNSKKKDSELRAAKRAKKAEEKKAAKLEVDASKKSE